MVNLTEGDNYMGNKLTLFLLTLSMLIKILPSHAMYDSYDDYIKKTNRDIAQNIKTAARLEGITKKQTVLLLISKAQYIRDGCSVYLRGAIKFVRQHVKTIESEQLNIIK